MVTNSKVFLLKDIPEIVYVDSGRLTHLLGKSVFSGLGKKKTTFLHTQQVFFIKPSTRKPFLGKLIPLGSQRKALCTKEGAKTEEGSPKFAPLHKNFFLYFPFKSHNPCPSPKQKP